MRSPWLPLLRVTRAAGLAVLLAAGGCVGYRLGSSLPPGIRSVHVPAFANQCGEPLVEVRATQAAIQEFQRDGTLSVAGAERADVVLKATVTRYVLSPVRYEKADIKAAAEYRLVLTAHLVVTRRANGEQLLDRQVTGETTFDVIGDLPSAKASALPAAAQDLAHNIVKSVVEYW